ncbi:hypothetical protein [Streptomyces sp. SID3343]|uniref:hypothetical protein n=1 Tax=Streptomyces sp. SID3343 TaxID=2690260 RepID=UPI00136AFA64|nr:hypothetical protein [Streptomyces sp. SID3343]MYV98631.1 hypothetical protein [Streptomyces sp. SID3343]
MTDGYSHYKPAPDEAIQCMGCQGAGLDTAGRLYRSRHGAVSTVWAGTRCPHCRGTGWLLNGPTDPPDGCTGGPWRTGP